MRSDFSLHTVDPMLSASGNLFKCHEEVSSLQPVIPPKRFYIYLHQKVYMRSDFSLITCNFVELLNLIR